MEKSKQKNPEILFEKKSTANLECQISTSKSANFVLYQNNNLEVWSFHKFTISKTKSKKKKLVCFLFDFAFVYLGSVCFDSGD